MQLKLTVALETPARKSNWGRNQAIDIIYFADSLDMFCELLASPCSLWKPIEKDVEIRNAVALPQNKKGEKGGLCRTKTQQFSPAVFVLSHPLFSRVLQLELAWPFHTRQRSVSQNAPLCMLNTYAIFFIPSRDRCFVKAWFA